MVTEILSVSVTVFYICFLTKCKNTVSYTHLDVYKRQVLITGIANRLINREKIFVTAKRRNMKYKRYDSDCKESSCNPHNRVNLLDFTCNDLEDNPRDVYKRQIYA